MVLEPVLLQVAGANSTSATQTLALGGSDLLPKITEILITLALIALMGAVATRVVERVALRSGASRSVARSVREWAAILMAALAVVAIGGITGISSDLTTLTAGGIVGLVVSLALQNTLSNIISGVLMLNDGILRLGDRIQFGSTKGEVVKINMRTTWVRDDTGVVTVIGNSNLAAGPIIMLSAKERLAKKLQA